MSKTDRPNVPTSWKVLLDPQDVDSLLKSGIENESGAIPQQVENRYAAIMASVWDAKLLITYLDLTDKLNLTERLKLYREQTAWLEQRQKEAQANSEMEKGGTAAAAMYSDAFIRVTRARFLELEKRISGKP
jgi:uncharacterized protein YecT (DUF1311 family)